MPVPRSTSANDAMAADGEVAHFGARIYLPSTTPPLDLSAAAARLQLYIESLCSQPFPDGPGGYVWNKDALAIRPGPPSSSTPPHLEAYMRTARSVDDEWLAVHLLRRASGDQALIKDLVAGATLSDASASASTSSPALTMRVWDEDGELLLIEGADALPAWLDPDNASGRVWLHAGRLHLIGPDVKGDSSLIEGGLGPVPDVEALRVILTTSSEHTTAPSALSDLIFNNRMPTYPSLSWAVETQHTTLAYLPSRVATILQAHPQLVSLATDALESREGPEDARVLRAMTHFGPASTSSLGETSSTPASQAQPILLTPVRLSRQMYATLLSLRVFPPKIFGQEWRTASELWWGQGLPSLLGAPLGEEGKADKATLDAARRRDVGAKIAMGMELLHANAKERRGSSRVKGAASLHQEETAGSAAELKAFRASLERMGYFEGEMEGSRRWKELERTAIESWRKQKRAEVDDEHVTDDVADLVEASASSIDKDASPTPIDASRPAAELASYEDPDTFVYEALASAARREAAEKSGVVASDGDADAEEEAAMQELGAFGSKLEAFLSGKGDATGALFEDVGMDEDAESVDDESEDEDEDEVEDAKGERLRDARERVMAMTAEDRSRALLEQMPGLREMGATSGAGKEVEMEDATEAKPKPAPTMLPGMKRGLDLPEPPSWSSTSVIPSTDISQPTPRDIESARAAAQAAKALLGTNKISYDGASDDEESLDEDEARGMESVEERRERARELGMEEEFEEDERKWREREEEDARVEEELKKGREEREAGVAVPIAVAGEEPTQMEVEAETKGFLEFARKALGLSEGQLEGIMREREERGAYVPSAYGRGKAPSGKQLEQQRKMFGPEPPPSLRTPGTAKVSSQGAARQEPSEESGKGKGKAAEDEAATGETPSFLSSFDEAMDSMERELERRRAGGGSGGGGAPLSSSSGKRKVAKQQEGEAMDEDSDEDEEALTAAQEAELLEAMRANGGWPGLAEKLAAGNQGGGAGGGAAGEGMEGMSGEMMAALLESFKGQGGEAGPVGNLASRLGVRLPREGGK